MLICVCFFSYSGELAPLTDPGFSQGFFSILSQREFWVLATVAFGLLSWGVFHYIVLYITLHVHVKKTKMLNKCTIITLHINNKKKTYNKSYSITLEHIPHLAVTSLQAQPQLTVSDIFLAFPDFPYNPRS